MTKSELIEKVADKTNITKKQSELLVNSIFEVMTDALAKEERIEIRGFASWYVKKYKAYPGRNPRTGEVVNVTEKKLPFFKVGKELKERVNGIK